MNPRLNLHTDLWLDNAREVSRARIVTHKRACLVLLPIAAAIVALAAWIILSGRFAL